MVFFFNGLLQWSNFDTSASLFCVCVFVSLLIHMAVLWGMVLFLVFLLKLNVFASFSLFSILFCGVVIKSL